MRPRDSLSHYRTAGHGLARHGLAGLARSLSILALLTTAAHANLFVENFTTDPGSTGGDVGGGDTVFSDSTLGFYLTTAVHDAVNGELDFEAFNRGNETNNSPRSRANGVLISLNGVAAGNYTLQFDVQNFVDGPAHTDPMVNESAENQFQVFSINGLGDSTSTNSVTLDFGNNNNNVDFDISVPGTSSASFTELLSGAITGDGDDQGGTFNLASLGTTSDLLFLVFQSNEVNGSDTFSIDDILISAVPEPSLVAVWSLASVGVVLRRRR